MAKRANAKKKVVKTIELKPYKSYPFRGQDPIVGKVHTVIMDAGVSVASVSRESGVAAGTMGNWFKRSTKRKTKRPQFATVNAVLMALNKELVISDRR